MNEAIILAGGLGTRLKHVVSDVPKCMAIINKKPFLEYLLNYLFKYNIKKVVLSVGYKYQIIQNYFSNLYKDINILYAIENEPLGTGGGIMNALNYIDSQQCLILNGDSFFNIDLNEFIHFNKTTNSQLSIALKPLENFNRYGSVQLHNNRIISFLEKKIIDKGYINGGIYAIDVKLLKNSMPQQKFSFENDFLTPMVTQIAMYGYVADDYFIDIGIPDDFYKAQNDFTTIF